MSDQEKPASAGSACKVGCRSTGEVAQKLKQLLFRHRKHEIEQALSRAPETCAHNRPTVVAGCDDPGLPRICGHGSQVGLVCDLDYEGDAQALGCPLWEPARGADQIKADFRALVLEGPAAVSKRYPDAAALMWVLGQGVEGDLDESAADHQEASPSLGRGILRILGRRA